MRGNSRQENDPICEKKRDCRIRIMNVLVTSTDPSNVRAARSLLHAALVGSIRPALRMYTAGVTSTVRILLAGDGLEYPTIERGHVHTQTLEGPDKQAFFRCHLTLRERWRGGAEEAWSLHTSQAASKIWYAAEGSLAWFSLPNETTGREAYFCGQHIRTQPTLYITATGYLMRPLCVSVSPFRSQGEEPAGGTG